jgi:secernin
VSSSAQQPVFAQILFRNSSRQRPRKQAMNKLGHGAAAGRLLSCDTLIARAGGDSPRAVFGKNSDRPRGESQPLELVPRGAHPRGAYLRCQYLSIPQAARTLRVLGSRPWWLWGFEHGLNEAGVAIGNEAIYTRDVVPDTGLLGMDLVRLGLERGETARAALETIVELLERHGQGGDAVNSPGYSERYQNSFLIADARESYVLETSARHWVYRRVEGSAAISNLVTIEDDWDEASAGIDAYARERGWWWGPPGRKLNFRLAFEDPSMRAETEDRYGASCRYLAAGEPSVSVGGVMRHLRDHFEGGTVQVPERPGEQRPVPICCHPGRLGFATAASMVVDLTAEHDPPLAWCGMSTPCTSAFLPVPVGDSLPVPMRVGGGTADDASLWWSMRALAERIEQDPAALAPIVQSAWFAWEDQLLAATADDPSGAGAELEARVTALLERRAELLERIAALLP